MKALGRLLVLVLSGLATFAIIGSLVSVSRLSSANAPQPQPAEQRTEAPPPVDRGDATQEPATGQMPSASGDAATARPIAAKAPERGIERWLEALTYAVLGLAGFVAVLVIVAMRAAAHLGTIADRC